MIFLDANVFLRWLAEPTTAADVDRNAIATAIFVRIGAGEIEATTSEAILAEVAFLLTSKRHYNITVEDAVAYLMGAVRMPGLKFAPGMKQRYVRALEIWGQRPRLGFVDALTVAIVEGRSHALVSFDRDFDPFDDIEYWRPENGHAGEDALPVR
jgi:predicted nucleic acid-binding protein